MDSYKTLEKIFKKLNDINQIIATLHWDMSVIMPSGGASARAEQISTLTSIHHAILSDEGVGDLIATAKSDESKLDAWQRANLFEMGKTYNHTAAVPAKLMQELATKSIECEMAWRKAKAANKFSIFKPKLENIVKLVRQIAKIKGEAFQCDPYDALLDQYDRGRTSKEIDVVFDDLKEFLPDFIQSVIEKQASLKAPIELKGPFNIDKQKQLANKMLKTLQFDLETGRLDESMHPFCGGYKGDIRITTRYDEENFLSAVMGVQHEGGHALYEAGLPNKWQGQPVGNARGMSIHESQSLLIEMQVCRSREFLEYAAPIYKEVFGGRDDSWTADNIYGLCTKVQPSFIRVDADEVTYPAHILLRYYLEKYLISGQMEVADLPEAWAQGMERFLGVKPDNDNNGCMQDIHWTDGSFGYFPTYTLGAIYAAQFFKAALTAKPEIKDDIKKGDFSNLASWLNKNIHSQACRYGVDELVKKATGSGLDVQIYKDHLKARYLGS